MSRPQKLLLALGTPFFLFGAFELALRLARFEFVTAAAPILIWNPVEDRRMEEGRSLHVADPVQLWKPRAGAEVEWGEAERVNAAGWRGPLVPKEKPPGVLRVATLGDSSTFGMHVAYRDCYSGRLETLLREAGREAQVMDCGVIGYTARQGLERYRELVREYRPDVVVAAFGAVNEHYGKIGVADVRKIARGKGASAFLERVLPRLRLTQFLTWLRHQAAGGEEGVRAARQAAVAREHELMRTAGNLDWTGERRVSLADFDRALTELAREVEADGGRLVLIAMPRVPTADEQRPVLLSYTERVHRVAARERLPLLDAHALFRERFAAGRPPAELFAGDWWHPNAEGHEILARGLLPLVLEAAGEPE